MAELINEKDNLNKGRIKLNEAIRQADKSAQVSEDAKEKSEQSLAKSESTQTQLDTIVIEGDSSVEAAQARIDEKGETHSTLKDRIDDGFKITTKKTDGLKLQFEKSSGVLVTEFGAIGDGETDDTESINNAIEYAHLNNLNDVLFPSGTFLIDPGESDHVPLGDTGGIQLRSNTSLILSDSTVIKSKPMSSKGYNIIGGNQVVNVVIIGGLLVGDRDNHIGTEGEYGHGINLMSCKNVIVKDVTVSNCWGDGFYVGGKDGASEDIRLENVVATNNRRQGLSVTHVDGMVIKNSEFSNTNGTSPQAGIDIEPNNNEKTVNILMENIICNNNETYGMQIYTRADTNSVVKDIRLNGFKAVGGERGIAVREMGGSISNLHFQNFELTKNQARGLWISDGNIKNIIIKDFKIDGTPEGVELRDTDNLTMINGEVINLETQALRLRRCDNTTIDNLKIHDLEKKPSSPESAGMPAGIWVEDSKLVILKNLDIYNMPLNAIRLTYVNNSNLSNINATGIGEDVIQISGGSQLDLSDLIIKDNVFKESDVYRFVNISGGATNSTLRNIIATTNVITARYGVQLSSSTENIYVSNVYMKNSTHKRALVDGGVNNISNEIIGKEVD